MTEPFNTTIASETAPPNKARKVFVAFVAFSFAAGSAFAQSYQTYGDGFGGSTIFGSDGSTAHTYDDQFGGSVTFGTTPDGGSWTAHTYSDPLGGSTTFVNPDSSR